MKTSTPVIEDGRLEPIAAKVLARERLSFEDGVALYRSPDLLALGWLANYVREKRHGDVCYFNVNRHINPTNVCVAHCKLCAFGRSPDAPGAYTFALEEIWQRAEQGLREGATEFHLVGGLHPDLPFDYFLDLIRGLKVRCPGVHLKAFTMVEVGYFARISKLSISDTLLALKDAGVDSLPGGGAEIFNPRVRKVICDHKVSGQQWLNIARTAHQIGLRSNATMLYGHIESDEERAEHLLSLRALQDETGGFVAFIPLAFHPENTGLAHLPKPTGFTDLKTRGSRTSRPSQSHACCSIISTTSKLIGSCSPRAWRKLRCGLGPMISTARSWRKKSITMPAPPPRSSRRAPSSNG